MVNVSLNYAQLAISDHRGSLHEYCMPDTFYSRYTALYIASRHFRAQIKFRGFIKINHFGLLAKQFIAPIASAAALDRATSLESRSFRTSGWMDNETPVMFTR